ncbi:uncharacterized protein EI90DRAFT_3078339 [Cantharellus anzutake]|uniref:uncharacterized protein n=1 Tax=Cantharellus anzutake TaxID=1750568 RepID=UPI001905AD78|nr:uncharacterized protein EI90DRAFT_3078339 [Cantharellus anzutake]KAF8321964.1 hypothetical protein EI90DRAFT_3078339 [Cantharellus anzutake]
MDNPQPIPMDSGIGYKYSGVVIAAVLGVVLVIALLWICYTKHIFLCLRECCCGSSDTDRPSYPRFYSGTSLSSFWWATPPPNPPSVEQPKPQENMAIPRQYQPTRRPPSSSHDNPDTAPPPYQPPTPPRALVPRRTTSHDSLPNITEDETVDPANIPLPHTPVPRSPHP